MTDITQRKLREAVAAIVAADITREAMIELAKGALVRLAPDPPDLARLGRQRRYAAEDIFDRGAPSVEVAYEYMQFHPQHFQLDQVAGRYADRSANRTALGL